MQHHLFLLTDFSLPFGWIGYKKSNNILCSLRAASAMTTQSSRSFFATYTLLIIAAAFVHCCHIKGKQ